MIITQHDLDEIESTSHHLHNRERWFGKKAVQTATDWADDTLSLFRAISGNNGYGGDANDEAKVLGTDDTPVFTGSAYFDLHRIYVSAASATSAYKLRVVWGTGTMAAAITAGQTSEVVVDVSASSRAIPVSLRIPRLPVKTQVWVQAWNATDNATIDFMVGLHEYDK